MRPSPLRSSCFAQECFNSLYGHVHFPVYAEEISYTPGQTYDVASSPSQTVKMLSAAAKEEGVWLIGGTWDICLRLASVFKISATI